MTNRGRGKIVQIELEKGIEGIKLEHSTERPCFLSNGRAVEQIVAFLKSKIKLTFRETYRFSQSHY